MNRKRVSLVCSFALIVLRLVILTIVTLAISHHCRSPNFCTAALARSTNRLGEIYTIYPCVPPAYPARAKRIWIPRRVSARGCPGLYIVGWKKPETGDLIMYQLDCTDPVS
jgi:hypothetical protein